jgi:RecA-family ATPase
MIPQGGSFLLHGKPGVGKTQLITTLAEAVNTGGLLFGRWPCRQGPVVVVQADMTSQIQQQRLLRVIQTNTLPYTYWVIEPDGSTPLINIRTMHVHQQELIEQMQEVDPVLTIWDTLRKIHDMPESASETSIAVLNAARKMLPLSTHGFVHHDRKQSRDPDANEHMDEAFMGSQQWKGAIDAQIQLTELSTSPKRLVCKFHKARTAPDTEREPFTLEMDMDSLLLKPLRKRRNAMSLSDLHRYGLDKS